MDLSITTDIRFKCPFNMNVIGPTMTGKTEFVIKLLNHQEILLEKPVKNVYWFTPTQAPPNSLINNNIDLHVYHDEMPWEVHIPNDITTHKIVVIDDYSCELADSKELTKFYTKWTHHSNVSIIQMSQNLFMDGKGSRTRSLNLSYLVLMRQTRDMKQIRTLARQMANDSKEYNAIIDAYQSAMNTGPYSYLVISFHPRDHPKLKLRSNIFNEDNTPSSVYVINNRGVGKKL